jgi:hypothetical protein
MRLEQRLRWIDPGLIHKRGSNAMEQKGIIDNMDKLVKRVTIVQGSGETRRTEVVYESEHEDEEDRPNLQGLERSIRHVLKAQVIAAQEAYQRHLSSAGKGGMAWMTEAPGNIVKATRKAAKEMRKSVPFGSRSDEEEDEGHGD